MLTFSKWEREAEEREAEELEAGERDGGEEDGGGGRRTEGARRPRARRTTEERDDRRRGRPEQGRVMEAPEQRAVRRAPLLLLSTGGRRAGAAARASRAPASRAKLGSLTACGRGGTGSSFSSPVLSVSANGSGKEKASG